MNWRTVKTTGKDTHVRWAQIDRRFDVCSSCVCLCVPSMLVNQVTASPSFAVCAAWSHSSASTGTNVVVSALRFLDNFMIRWEHYLSCSEKLALQHAQRACEIYCFAQVTETALLHLPELRTVYTNTLTAKKDYHLLVTNLLKERIETQRLHNAYTAMCVERRQWYD